MSYERVAVCLIDPSEELEPFTFSVNPNAEEPVQNSRQIAWGAPVDGLTLIPQQGVQYPLPFQWEGNLYVPAEKAALELYYAACEDHTIFFRDFEANWFEGLISDFNIQRVTGLNRRGGGLPYYWKYTMILQNLAQLTNAPTLP